jgi:hypothetical protein
MISISNKTNNDGTIEFSASDGSSLVIEIEGSSNKAKIIKVNAPHDVYDALAKTAIAYARRRGISFEVPNDLKPTKCNH